MSYNIDYSLFFTHNILMYKLFGFWRPDKNMKYKNLYNCYTAVCTAIWILFLASQYIYIYTNIQNVEEVTATLFVTATFSIDLIKMLVIYRNMNRIKKLIKDLNRPMFQIKCKRHMKIAKETKKLNTRFFYACLYLGAQTDVFWSILPFIRDEKVTLARGWFPYDETKRFNYELTYLFQNAVSIWNTMICLNLDTFTSSLLIQIGLQCDLLCVTLENLGDFHVDDMVLKESSEEFKLLLVKDAKKFSGVMTDNLLLCIKHHKGIMRVAKDVENIHKVSVFILFIGGAFILCSCLFQLSMVRIGCMEFFMLLFYLISMLTEQFVYCWFGNEVIQKSSRILDSAYCTPWIECDIKFRKFLLQFMTQAHRPIKLRAGGLFTMSISVFISVLRTTYSYFTLLKKIG